MEESVQTFEPLVTEVHRVSEATAAGTPSLPAGLTRLVETGRETRKALLYAGLLALLSLALAAVLFLGPGKEADVVWQEDSQSIQSVLVEAP